MAFFLSPIGNEQQLDANGNPLNAGRILTYLAGSTTPTATYTDNTGATQQANPIILNSLGLPSSPIWLNGGITYKFVIQDVNLVTLRTVDNISGINDTTATQTEWVSSGFVPTFISTVSFSVPGDQTGTLQIGRRLRTQNTAGLIYSRITNSVFAATITTVTVVNDSGVLDSGLSSVSYGVAAPISPSLPNSVAVRDTMGITTARQNQEGIAYTTAGTSTAYTLTPSPAITAYAAGQSFFVTFNAASGAAPTLQISGIATPPNLVKQVAAGTYSNIAANDIPANHRSRITLLSLTQALVENLPPPYGGTGPAFSAYANANQALTSGVATKVALGTEIFDTDGCFDSTTNYRFTPTVPGFYQVNGLIRAIATNMTALIISIYKNGAEYRRGDEQSIPATSAVQQITVNEVVLLNGSTDYIELYANLTGTTPALQVISAAVTSCFSAAHVRMP